MGITCAVDRSKGWTSDGSGEGHEGEEEGSLRIVPAVQRPLRLYSSMSVSRLELKHDVCCVSGIHIEHDVCVASRVCTLNAPQDVVSMQSEQQYNLWYLGPSASTYYTHGLVSVDQLL